MRHLFQAYPTGVGGVGYLLMRASAASLVLSAAAELPSSGFMPIALSAALAGALVLGIGSRAVAVVSAVIAVLTLPGASWDMAMVHLALAFACSSMALIGPGAYSLDALRFGRKTIHVTRGRTPK